MKDQCPVCKKEFNKDSEARLVVVRQGQNLYGRWVHLDCLEGKEVVHLSDGSPVDAFRPVFIRSIK